VFDPARKPYSAIIILIVTDGAAVRYDTKTEKVSALLNDEIFVFV
jgi:hypothetical protein